MFKKYIFGGGGHHSARCPLLLLWYDGAPVDVVDDDGGMVVLFPSGTHMLKGDITNGFGFLSIVCVQILDAFMRDYGNSWQTQTQDSNTGDTMLESCLTKYQDPIQADKLLKIQQVHSLSSRQRRSHTA